MNAIITSHRMTYYDDIKVFHYKVPLYANIYRNLKYLFKNRANRTLTSEFQDRVYFSTTFQIDHESWVRFELKTDAYKAYIDIDLLDSEGNVVGGTILQRPDIQETWEICKSSEEDGQSSCCYSIEFYPVTIKAESVPYEYDRQIQKLINFLPSDRAMQFISIDEEDKAFVLNPCHLSRHYDLSSELELRLEEEKKFPSSNFIKHFEYLVIVYQAELSRKSNISIPALIIPYDAPLEEKLEALLNDKTFRKKSIARQNELIAKLLQELSV